MSLGNQLLALLGPYSTRPIAGGSICNAVLAEGPRGRAFVKTHPSPPPGFFAAEADGLGRLAPHVRVPRVLAVHDDALVLEWIEPTGRSPALLAEAGRALARLHAVRGERFGLARDNRVGSLAAPASSSPLGRSRDAADDGCGGDVEALCINFIGLVPQDNRAASDVSFATFFRERRIGPLAVHLPSDERKRLERMRWVIGETHPTLLHGDLWSGNLLFGADPVFIDPAVCYGHPEQDLAMTRLFGGFGDAFYAAYAEATGTVFDRDLDERLEQLSLYPLLVHVALFGEPYRSDVRRIVARFT